MARSVKLNEKGSEETRKAMLEKGLGLKDLADQAGVNITSVGRFVERDRVSSATANLLFHYLGITNTKDLLETEAQYGDVLVGSSGSDTYTYNIEIAAKEISEASVDDVQGIASAQLQILASYYSEGLMQAKTSFRWAATVSGIGFFFFLTAVILVLNRQPRDRTLIPLISGAVIEVVAGINFYLYGQATKQLATFQRKLDQTQRFLLANSICESLEGDSKQAARVELVKTVSSLVD